MPHDHKIEAQRMLEVLQAVRQADMNMTSRAMAVLFYVAAHPGTSGTDMAKALGEKQPMIAKAVAILQEQGVSGKEGLQLLEHRYEDPDGRVKNYYLSVKGRDLMNRALAPSGHTLL
ncbi:hypothetical protein [Labrys neptuniae]